MADGLIALQRMYINKYGVKSGSINKAKRKCFSIIHAMMCD